MQLARVVVFLLLCLERLECLSGNYVVVGRHGRRCIFKRAEAGTNLVLTFDVVEGGFLDIDVEVTDPEGKTVYQGLKEQSDVIAFKANSTGKYIFCFSNKWTTDKAKVVYFTIEVDGNKSSIRKENLKVAQPTTL